MRVRRQESVFITCLESKIDSILKDYLDLGFSLVKIEKATLGKPEEFEIFMMKQLEEDNE